MNHKHIKAGSLAIILYIILSLIDGFISLPLREASSFLSFLILKALSLDVDLNGTVLSTTRMTFDVIPACSGSTTLRVMILGGIIWSTLQKHLNLRAKLIISISAIPIALAANAFRLSAIVIFGHITYESPQEPLHSLTGLIAFTLAFLSLIYISSFFNKKDTLAANTSRIKTPLIETLLLLIWSIPSLLWIYKGWTTSPLDKFGFLWFLFTGPAIIYTIHKTPRSNNSKSIEASLLSCFMVSEVFNLFADINLLRCLNLILVVSYMICKYKGKITFTRSLPLIFTMSLALPTTTYIANQLLEYTPLAAGAFNGHILKLTLTVSLIIIWGFLLKKEFNSAPKSTPYRYALIACLSLALLLSSFSMSNDQQKSYTSTLKLSYLLGDWIGVNTQIDSKNKKLWSRIYKNNDLTVEVLINTSGGDRHELHPPEYCLTSGGWKVTDEQTINWLNERTQKTLALSEMKLTQEGQLKYFYHWYSDGEQTFSSYNEMLKEDTLRHFKGESTNWYLFRIIADSPPTVLDNFLDDFHGYFLQDNKEIHF